MRVGSDLRIEENVGEDWESAFQSIGLSLVHLSYLVDQDVVYNLVDQDFPV